MIKKTFFIAIYFLPFAALAQQNDSIWAAKRVHHQLNINATAFVKQFLSFNNSNTQNINSPFTAGYKLFFSNKSGNRLIGTRLGVGYTQNSQSGSPSTDLEVKSDVSNTSARAGAEVQHRITKRWVYFYGLDVVYTMDKTTVTTKFSSGPEVFSTGSTESIENIGGGPVLGFQFNINQRLSLSTEAAFYFLDGKNHVTSTTDFPTGGGPSPIPVDRTTKIQSLGFIAPSFINFNLMF